MKPGRPKLVRFPIKRIEVVYGHSRIITIEENQAVNCLMCGQQFHITRETTTILRGLSDMPVVRCPLCRYLAAICYYYDQIPKPKQKKSVRENSDVYIVS